MKKAASASKHWRLLSYLCSIRKAEVHNKLCADGLRHLLQFFILELSCFHSLVECLRGGVHPPGKFSFFYFGNSFSHFDFRWEIHAHHLTASINDFLYFVKKYFQKYRFFFKKSLDIIKEILYNIGVRRSGKLTGKENRPMDEKTKALKELLEILVEHPDLAERITITIKPNRIIQSNETPTDNK